MLSDSFTTRWPSVPSVGRMNVSPKSVVIEIVAHDLARSVEFYRLLGLTVPNPDGPHVEVDLPGGNKLAFDTEEVIVATHPGWTPPDRAGRLALAFEVGSPAEVDALFDTLVSAGHAGSLTPFDAPWGQRYATVEDPDGNTVDLFAALQDQP